MLGKMFDAVFGCWHTHYSFPISVRPGSRCNRAASLTGTYVVCLDCGKEFPYDWKEMRVLSTSMEKTRSVTALATKEAA